MKTGFDSHAPKYDAWFMANPNVLASEAALVAATLQNGGRILSVGCGSGLFESILREQYNIDIRNGIEPSEGMAEIARARGLDVTVAKAEDADFGDGCFDTILFNGTPSYIQPLKEVIEKAYTSLPAGGRIVLIDVPKESSYGLLYNLALALGTWEHPLLEGCRPPMPYPIEFVKSAVWRTTQEKVDLLTAAGFKNLSCLQTLTTHPLHSDDAAQQPIEGCDKGDYVAIIAWK